jgi:hypothetical protein
MLMPPSTLFGDQPNLDVFVKYSIALYATNIAHWRLPGMMSQTVQM